MDHDRTCCNLEGVMLVVESWEVSIDRVKIQ